MKIFKMIVRTVTIFVVNLISFGTWANKLLGNDAMDQDQSSNGSFSEVYQRISVGVEMAMKGCLYSGVGLSGNSPNSPKIGNLVPSLKPGDIFPRFRFNRFASVIHFHILASS